MFTGIIEEIGTIKSIVTGSKSATLTIEALEVLKDSKIGDSIAVNGVCLTATSIQKNAFTADVMAETMRRSSFANIEKGSRVNLERAMAANGRFGGHIVSGHIDGTGKIISMLQEDNAVWVRITASDNILRLVVEKGSIAIDGISLTVAKVDRESFSVSVIPHTKKETTLLGKNIGDFVNLENDVVGKYIEKLLDNKQEEKKQESNITMDFLAKNGF